MIPETPRDERSFKERLRTEFQRTKTGSTMYFAYGQLRQMPTRMSARVARWRNESLDRRGVAPEWNRPVDYQWKVILRRQAAPHPAESGPRVLFATGNGFNPFVTALHSTLAVALAQRGARPEFLACDKALPACDWNAHGNMDPDPTPFGPRLPRVIGLTRCRQCTAGLTGVYEQLPFALHRLGHVARQIPPTEVQALRDGLNVDDLKRVRHRDIAVGEHAYATTVRLLMRGTLDESNPQHLWLLRRELLGAARATDLFFALFATRRPDVIVMQHGIYVTHGVLSDVARQLDVRVVVHEWSDRKNTFIWSHGQTTHRELLGEPSDAWAGRPLMPSESAELDSYLDSKRFSGQDWMCHYPNPQEDWAQITRETGLRPGDAFVALFTNTMWDAQISYGSAVFPTLLDWIVTTIDYARRRPDVTFVIREHPGEARVWGRPGQRLPEELAKRVPELPVNVLWIPAESDVSSYALAGVARASVVYGTKLGLELAVRGHAVIVAGNAFVRGKGVTHDIESQAQYTALLDQVPHLPCSDAATVERARRYAHHYYFRRVVEIPHITMENPTKGTKATLRFDSVRDLAPGLNPALDRICAGILDQEPFVFA